jgi:hypothetical protein
MDNEPTQHQNSIRDSGDVDQDEKLHAEKLNHDGQLPESNNLEAEPVDTHHGNVSVVEDKMKKKKTSVPVWRLVSACH